MKVKIAEFVKMFGIVNEIFKPSSASRHTTEHKFIRYLVDQPLSYGSKSQTAGELMKQNVCPDTLSNSKRNEGIKRELQMS